MPVIINISKCLLKSCPVCKEPMDTESEEFRDLVCNSTRVFIKAVKTPREGDVFEHLFFITNTTQRSPNTNLSVTIAFKDRKKVLIDRTPEQRLLNMRRREDLNYTRKEYFPQFVRYQMHQECICDPLDKTGELLVIFDTKDQFNELRNELSFTETTTIIRETSDFYVKVFIFLRRRKCEIIP